MSGDVYHPPFTLTSDLVRQVANIAQLIGQLTASAGFSRDLHLRRLNRIRSVTGSLAIEGNTLSEEQVTALLAGEPVLAPPREVLEVRNALRAYDTLPQWDALSERDLLAAHQVLMTGLVDHPGRYRLGGVGVVDGIDVIHLAPPAGRVPELMGRLFEWLRGTDQHPLIASSVFHYEFEFIHPFSDGNGRMGRLWQTLALTRWEPVFAWLPVESLVHQHQAEYYTALEQSTTATDSAHFIRFMLGCIEMAVRQAAAQTPATMSGKMSGILSGKTSQQVLALVGETPTISIPELAEALGVSGRTVERAIRRLREAGLLHRVGPAKGGRWEAISPPRPPGSRAV